MTIIVPDQGARDRIQHDLTTNLLVEAGAGSGKTTALVSRLLEHVITGTPVEQLAAVTFTRKAAEELRERFQLRLEQAVRDETGDALTTARCATALRDLDRAFLGTIHSFCARLLRERPVDVGLDPDFSETAEQDVEPLRREFWRTWIDAARRLDDADVQALHDCGINTADLHDAFARVMTFHDVEFPAPPVPMPDVAGCMNALWALLARAEALMPVTPLDGVPDDLMRLVHRLRYQRGISELDDPVVCCVLLDGLKKTQMKAVQKRWAGDSAGKKQVKELETDCLQLLTDIVTPVLRQWREYRYPIVMRVLQRAVADYAAQRHDRGQLGFDDLLLLCARLLRERPSVRNELGLRYRYLLVDEFQDTDPVQAEVCLLLASDASEGTDWQAVTPRPGALFVVGDPKQSIYRFRRADIQVYERVKARFATFGDTLSLTANFRSTAAIGTLVNTHFARVFPAGASNEQAAFSPLIPAREFARGVTSGIMRYVVRYESGGAPEIIARDAELLAAWIANRIAEGERPGDFLVLTAKKAPIASYARALAERNIPVSTTGASLTQELELQEVMVILRALADPGNAVLVAAALEGLFFGLSPADLYSAREAGIALSIVTPGIAVDHRVARALDVLRRWWTCSREQSADVLLERIFNDTGLLFLAAGSVLGDARAGALLHLVEVVRGSAVGGQSGLADAIVLLDALLESDADDAPLRPGRSDAVRVMNLHKAKGLEAEIVILAAPTDQFVHEPDAHVVRGHDGAASGGVLIATRSTGRVQPIAQPLDWQSMQDAERLFHRAESDRLRYVAVTRARRAVVFSQAEKIGKTTKPDSSMWRPLAETVDGLAEAPLEIRVTIPEGRRILETDAASLETRVQSAAARVEAGTARSLTVQTVTGSVKGDSDSDEPLPERMKQRGRTWGTVVHRCIDAMVRGRRGDRLTSFVAAVIAEERMTATDATNLRSLLEQVEASPAWQSAVAAGTLHSELAVMQVVRTAGSATVTEGVIDLAVLGDAGWQVVDWKSDDTTDTTWASRLPAYQAQVAQYADMLSGITGQPASATIERVRLPRDDA